jgi:hypothetical protein
MTICKFVGQRHVFLQVEYGCRIPDLAEWSSLEIAAVQSLDS